jgi:hypothetical protein
LVATDKTLLNPGIGYDKILRSDGIKINPGEIAKFNTTLVFLIAVRMLEILTYNTPSGFCLRAEDGIHKTFNGLLE